VKKKSASASYPPLPLGKKRKKRGEGREGSLAIFAVTERIKESANPLLLWSTEKRKEGPASAFFILW